MGNPNIASTPEADKFRENSSFSYWHEPNLKLYSCYRTDSRSRPIFHNLQPSLPFSWERRNIFSLEPSINSIHYPSQFGWTKCRHHNNGVHYLNSRRMTHNIASVVHINISDPKSATMDAVSEAVLSYHNTTFLFQDGSFILIPTEASRRRVATHFATQFDAVAGLTRYVRAFNSRNVGYLMNRYIRDKKSLTLSSVLHTLFPSEFLKVHCLNLWIFLGVINGAHRYLSHTQRDRSTQRKTSRFSFGLNKTICVCDRVPFSAITCFHTPFYISEVY